MHAVGLDIGGTKIEGILADNKGRVLKRLRIPTAKTRKQIISDIIEVIAKLKTKKIAGIGIGMPGFIGRRGWPNIPALKSIDLERILKKKFRTKVKIENDANCFALAEHRFGAAKGRNIIGVIIGTGIGGGLVLNSRIYAGVHDAAGEFGHMIIDSSSKFRCGCGNYGDFESLCSGPGIAGRYKKAGGKLKTAEEIFKSNEKTAKKIINETYHYLGIGVANLVNIFNPDVIVFGGGVSKALSYRKLKKEVLKHNRHAAGKHVKLVKNKLGDSSGVLGAAALVLEW